MPSTVYKGDISEATFGHETGFTLEYDYHNGLRFSVQATSGDITTLRITAGGASGQFVDTSQNLRYPTGLLAGSKLRVKGGGALSADDHASNGHIYTIVDNYGTDILVTPALKTSAVTAATAGDALIIDSLGTPSIDVGMAYNAVAAASDETVLTDQFLGLAATLTFPETKAEIRRSHVIGIGRDVVVQEPQRFTNEGGSLEMMLNSPRWLYYGLGNEVVYGGITVKATCAGPAAKAISMGDTYIEFNTGTVSNAPALGDYILVVDTTATKTPTDLVDENAGASSKWTQLETQFDTTERNEMRRVICIDTTGAYTRIHVDDPFNFNHASLAATAFKVVTLLDDDTTGSPHFDTATATYGRIQNRQSRAIFSGYRTPSFSLETSMRTRDVDSYGHDGTTSPATYVGGQLSNVPDTASDSKQLTRIYKGCKVKEWTLTADADAEVKMSVAFDALMCYTDTGRLEDNTAATATLTVANGSAAHGMAKNTKVNIVSADGTSVDYIISATNDSGAAHLSVLTGSSNVGGGTTPTITGGATAIAVGFDVSSGLTQNAFLALLKAAIEHTNGHAGKITVSAVPAPAGGAQSITLTQVISTVPYGFGNTTITETITNLSKTDFTGGTQKGDRYTAHRVFENIANGSAERKIAGIAPNTEKPYFFYNGTISAFGMNIAQVTNFNLSGRNNTVTHFTIRGNPNAESRNTAGQSLEQVPFAGSRNPSLIVEGKVEYEMAMTIIVSDPLLWHEFRSNRTHNETEPIKLTLTKAGAGSNREELIVIVDDYIIAEAPLGIPEDKGVIKSELKIMPKHVKVVSHDALMHS